MSKNTKPVDPEAKIKRLQKSLDYYKGQVEDCKRIMRRQQSVIEAERALADRLAEAMQGVMLEERDLPVASCRGFIDFDQAILALEKWKEARSE